MPASRDNEFDVRWKLAHRLDGDRMSLPARDETENRYDKFARKAQRSPRVISGRQVRRWRHTVAHDRDSLRRDSTRFHSDTVGTRVNDKSIDGTVQKVSAI